ncbi:MAG: PAS domain S-box protein [Bacillati bacterium ANGP1]|uniref:Oxygen sensor histidine kinase NreB n=1 Tax=Candidatus Segetimicrobium genomatis TaxID=2569760 RepID=A0A537J4Y1_9BACT|nr:MAG: PAS domain S-box protein [Terrabacteria group bacterium ANGP1]
MSQLPPEMVARYTAALKEYLFEGGEAALQRAYEFGRGALGDGLGVLEVAAVHHQAMVEILGATSDELPGALAAAGQFLAEGLSPFEMTHRGYREANAALQVSERRYRELFENANDVVFTTDLAGKFTSVNRTGENLTGYGRDELASMGIEALVAPEQLPVVRRMLERMLAGEVERTRYEIEIVTRDGRRIPMEMHTSLLHQDGRPAGVHGIARDVTERKQAEQALRGLNERLEEEAKRIAHALHDDAGQLLSTVHLALEEFAHGLPPGARAGLHAVRELLDQVQEELRRLSHELRPTILDDLGLLPALEFLADRVAKRSGLVITVQGSTEGRLAPPVETAFYRSVQEALTNTVRHAQATRVDVEIRRAEGTVRCSVRDDGIGFGVSTVLSRRGERGLGLIGIRERADALGGTLAIKSAQGQGTELLIAIPLGN